MYVFPALVYWRCGTNQTQPFAADINGLAESQIHQIYASWYSVIVLIVSELIAVSGKFEKKKKILR